MTDPADCIVGLPGRPLNPDMCAARLTRPGPAETLAEGEDADRGLGSEGSDSGSEDSQQALEVASAQHRSSTRQTQAHDITPAGDNKRSKTEF